MIQDKKSSGSIWLKEYSHGLITRIIIVVDMLTNIKYLLFLQFLKISKNKDDKKITIRGVMPPDKNPIPEPKPRTILARKGLLKYNEKAYRAIV